MKHYHGALRIVTFIEMADQLETVEAGYADILMGSFAQPLLAGIDLVYELFIAKEEVAFLDFQHF